MIETSSSRRIAPRGSRAAAASLAAAGLLGAAAIAGGQPLDAASASALSQTLKVLTDPSARSQAIAGNTAAGEVDRQVQALAGSPELTQEFYALAGEVFADLTRSTGGDVEKMSAALDRAKSDPAGFAALLSPQTIERLRALSVKISDAKH